jgi:peptidoglycan/LPS O-acetylase OafA/YrhL
VFFTFIPLLGTGPLFFGYAQNQCDTNWLWHLLFLNNVIPWSSRDNCMNWTWYLACEMQFFLLLPSFVHAYYHNRSKFWFLVVFWWTLSNMISVIVIVKNDLSASYFTYADEYWTIFYEMPFVRLPCYLIGVVWGCSYYSYKYEDEDQEEEMPSPIVGEFIPSAEEDPGSGDIQARQYKPQNLLIALFRKI